MKKIWMLLLSLALAFSVCACGGSEPVVEPVDSTTEATESSVTIVRAEESEEEKSVVLMDMGDKIITEDYELVINKVEFSYDVKPSDTSGYYYSYPAEDNQVYVAVRGEYKNISERDHCIRDLPIPVVVYDTDYTYNGQAMIDCGSSFDWADSFIAATPLQTSKYCAIVDCPEEVKTGEGYVVVLFVIDGTTYQYNLNK